MSKPSIAIIFVVVLLDIIAFSILLPVLSYYAATFGATPFQIGLVASLYAFCQLVAAPVLARLSDSVGRKPMMIIDVVGSILGLLLLGFASSLWMVFASRVIAGLVAANIPIAQAYISDITDHRARSRGLGVLGAAFGLGFTIGPMIGGIISRSGSAESYAQAALVSSGCAMVNLFIIVFALRESLPAEQRWKYRRIHKTQVQEDVSNQNTWNNDALSGASARPAARMPLVSVVGMIDIAAWQRLFRQRSVLAMLVFWVLFSLAFAMFQQNIALFNQFHLRLSARQTSAIFAFIGLSVAISQGVLLRWLTHRLTDIQLLVWSTPIFAASLLLWAWTLNLIMLYVALVGLCVSGSILIAVTNSLLTKSVQPSETGGIMGIAGMVDNSTRVLGAVVGGALIQSVGTFAPGVTAATIAILLVFFALFVIQRLSLSGTAPVGKQSSSGDSRAASDSRLYYCTNEVQGVHSTVHTPPHNPAS
jgi:DHA1 family tetracycline resistance protein-like MFS transporter